MKPLPLIALLLSFAVAGPAFAQDQAAAQEFDKRYAKVDQSDVDALMELAEWADGKGLTTKARLCYRKILRIDPNHPDANLALGNVKVGDKWVPKALAEREREQLEKDGGTKGETPAGEMTAPKGDRAKLELPNEPAERASVEGSLRANRDKAGALMKRFADSSGVDESEYAAGESQHCVVVAQESQEAIDTLAQIGEYAYRRLNWITWGKTDVNCFQQGGGKHIYYLVDDSAYSDLIAFLVEEYPQAISRPFAKEILRQSDQVGGFSLPAPLPMHLTKTPDNRSATIANGMGHHWLNWNSRLARAELNIKTKLNEGDGSKGQGRGHLTNWLQEGVGMWSALDAIGINNFFRITQQVYKNVGRAKKGVDTDFVGMCYLLATNQLGAEIAAKNFYQLTRAGLNQLSDLDLAMAWSIVDYLIRERTEDWRGLVTQLNKLPSFRMAMIEVFGDAADKKKYQEIMTAKDDNALWELYRTVCERFEIQWRDWVKRAYRAEYEDPTKRDRPLPPFTPIERQRGKAEGEDGDGKPGEKEKPKEKKPRRRRR